MLEKNEFFIDYMHRVNNIYEGFKTPSISKESALNEAHALVSNRLKFEKPEAYTEEYLETLYQVAYNNIVGFVDYGDVEVMQDDNLLQWFTEETRPKYAYYWERYRKYLMEYKMWSHGLVNSIDKATDEILSRVGNPNAKGNFDKRGLVLGHVQSGKTANFTGVINKAFDVGYKLIIVLAGMHNDLRSQTQLRLNQEVIGVGIDGKRDGVSLVKMPVGLKSDSIESWTSVEQDITSAVSHGIKNLEKPVLLVVKKQKDVLNNLIEILSASIEREQEAPAVLVIDDEADQASVNSNKDLDPTTINKLIRQLLDLFTRSSYVGYTATPFANLLINAKNISESDLANNISMDLYPKDFVIALPEPQGYCGPKQFFNAEADAEDDRMFIRYLSQQDEDLFKQIKKKDDVVVLKDVPPSMQEAIASFILVIAIRNLRQHHMEHNSMLIHATRLIDGQQQMAEILKEFFTKWAHQITFNQDEDNCVVQFLKNLYDEDFINKQRTFYANEEEKPVIFEWQDVYEEVRKIINTIEIMSINGESDDTLEYENYKEQGLNVIAVGGNKLSRGLTLEGLSVSYYYRPTDMYDTLLQMGRWFGFRKGYLDLCRIYTTKAIADNFSHLADVMDDLRFEFTKLVDGNIKPSDYAIQILSHSKLKLTSAGKMKHAKRMFNYTGTMQQTRLFEKTIPFYENNMKATAEFINAIDEFNVIQDRGINATQYHVAYDVDVNHVLSYLKNYQTSNQATKVTTENLLEYIQINLMNRAFTKFNVIVVDDRENRLNSPSAQNQGIHKWPVNLGKLKIESAVLRSLNSDKSNTTSSVKDIGSIVSSNQEFADIPERTSNKKTNLELRDANNPALLIYPLHPQVQTFKDLDVGFSEDLVPIGIAMSLPSRVINENGVDVTPSLNEYITNRTVSVK